MRRAAVILGAAALAVVPAASAGAKTKRASLPNAVYTATNDPHGNHVVVYKRNSNGSLTKKQTISTHAPGIAAQPPFGFPIVDSSDSLILSQDGKWLFVVNDGDNTITSFKVLPGPKLKFVDRASSGGVLPVSLASHGNLLYTVNEESGNIAGFKVSKNGKLSSIPGSSDALSTVGPDGVAADIGFKPDGKALIVTLRHLPREKGVIDTFRVNRDGSTGPAIAHDAADANPFGFAFSGHHALISNVGFVATPPNVMPNPADPNQFNGSLSSYDVHDNGSIDQDDQQSTNSRAACWVAVTPNGKFAYVTNTLSQSKGNPGLIGSGVGALSIFSVSSAGKTTWIKNVDVQPGPPGFPGDERVSRDGKYLYVLVPTAMTPQASNSRIDVFRIAANGDLTALGGVTGLPNGVSGLGVR